MINHKHTIFYALLITISGIISGCAGILKPIENKTITPIGSYRYQPLNPTTIWYGALSEADKNDGMNEPNWQSKEFKSALLRELDTETVRISLDTLNVSSELSAGVASTSIKDTNYVLVLDYIKYNSSSKLVDFDYTVNESGIATNKKFTGHIPVYAGIGLRIRAEFIAHESGLNISGLPAIAVAASTEGISGQLTVSTLGITGAEISSLMPIISDISVTSIQNAVQAVGAIKAKIYEDDTVVALKIIGYESPNTDGELLQKITEYLYGANLVVYPVVSINPENPTDKNDKIYWINWRLDSWHE